MTTKSTQFKQTLIQATVMSLCMCKTDDQREYTNTLTLMMEMYDGFLKTLEPAPSVVPKFAVEKCYDHDPFGYIGHRIHAQRYDKYEAISEPMPKERADALCALLHLAATGTAYRKMEGNVEFIEGGTFEDLLDRVSQLAPKGDLEKIVAEFDFKAPVKDPIKIKSKFELLKSAMGMIASHNVPFLDLPRGGRSNTAQAYAEHILKSLDRLHDLDDTAMADIKKLLEVKPETPDGDVVESISRMVDTFDPAFRSQVQKLLAGDRSVTNEALLETIQTLIDKPSKMLDPADVWALLGGAPESEFNRDKVVDSIKTVVRMADNSTVFLNKLAELFGTEGTPGHDSMLYTISEHVLKAAKDAKALADVEEITNILPPGPLLNVRDGIIVKWLADVCNSLESTVGERDAAHLLMTKIQKSRRVPK